MSRKPIATAQTVELNCRCGDSECNLPARLTVEHARLVAQGLRLLIVDGCTSRMRDFRLNRKGKGYGLYVNIRRKPKHTRRTHRPGLRFAIRGS